MPKLDTTYLAGKKRILLVGDPGTGKTTAVGHLLEHGYKLFVADFDRKLGVIGQHVPKQFHQNLVYATLVDKQKIDQSSGRAIPIGKPTAYPKFSRLLDRWVDDDGTDYGSPQEWDSNTWLVVDGLTSFTQAVLRWIKADRGVSATKTSGPTLGIAIEMVEAMVGTFLGFNLNLLVIAHLKASSAAEKDMFGDASDAAAKEALEDKREAVSHRADKMIRYPNTVGRDLPRYIGGYFTAVIQAKNVGSGPRTQKVLSTVPDNDVLVQVPVANKVLPPEMPLNQLHKIIEAIGGGNEKAAA